MRLKILRITLMLALAVILGIPCAYALDLPEDALLLLAEAAIDPCSICAKQKVAKAVVIMNDRFVPGAIMKADERCPLRKGDTVEGNELSLSCYPSVTLKSSVKDGQILPKIILRFSTPQKHLVGISQEDYTAQPMADLYQASPRGRVFEGLIRLVPYKYGDGLAYTYLQQMNTLMIHCVILELKPVVK